MWRSAELALVLTVVACTATSTSSPSPSASPVAALGTRPPDDPTGAVAQVLPPFSSATAPCAGSTRDALYRRAQGCPITSRLEDRVHTDALAAMNPMCRCQSAPSSTEIVATDPGGRTVRVTFKGGAPYVITFALIKDGATWRIDETWCGDDRRTSIYMTPLASCGG